MKQKNEIIKTNLRSFVLHQLLIFRVTRVPQEEWQHHSGCGHENKCYPFSLVYYNKVHSNITHTDISLTI